MSGNRNKKDSNRLVRKLGEREEVIETKLTQIELEDKRMEVMILLDDEEAIERKAKEASANFTSQLKTNKLQRNELRRVITSGKSRQTLVIEEHLTAANEVVRVRKDTGDIIGQPRTATARELQEDLFQDPPADPAPQGDAPSDAAEEEGGEAGFAGFDEPA
jgi:hypothetical protein